MALAPKPAVAGRVPATKAPREPSPRLLEDLPNQDLFEACRKAGDLWKLNGEVLAGLLGTSRSTWFRWMEGKGQELRWTPDQRTRALAILRIFEAVGDLHQDDREAFAWIHQPFEGPGFEGRTPLEVMASGIEGLLQVRDYLNFLHNGWS